MTISIQKASLSNLSDIQELNLCLFEKEQKEFCSDLDLNRTYSNNWINYFTERINWQDWVIYIAKDQEKIIAYLCWAITEAESYRLIPDPVAELENMYVDIIYRWQWIWSRLYSSFLEWCKEKWVKKIRVEASIDNIEAIQFYQKQWAKSYSMRLEHTI